MSRVLGDWTGRNDTRTAVVGVQVGNDPPVFVTGNAPGRSRITETSPLRIHGLPSAFTSTADATPRRLLAFSNTYLRAHVRGRRDLSTSFFRIGPTGTGTGVQGVSNDGLCALAPKGCPPGTRFFAVAATGSFPGGSAVIVYDPAHDVSVVAVARARPLDVGNLGLRADLLTTLGADGYDRAVGFAARPVPTTLSH